MVIHSFLIRLGFLGGLWVSFDSDSHEQSQKTVFHHPSPEYTAASRSVCVCVWVRAWGYLLSLSPPLVCYFRVTHPWWSLRQNRTAPCSPSVLTQLSTATLLRTLRITARSTHTLTHTLLFTAPTLPHTRNWSPWTCLSARSRRLRCRPLPHHRQHHHHHCPPPAPRPEPRPRPLTSASAALTPPPWPDLPPARPGCWLLPWRSPSPQWVLGHMQKYLSTDLMLNVCRRKIKSYIFLLKITLNKIYFMYI